MSARGSVLGGAVVVALVVAGWPVLILVGLPVSVARSLSRRWTA